MDGRVLDLYSFCVVLQGFFKLFCFKMGQGQVIVCRCLVRFHLRRSFQILDWIIQFSLSPIAYTSIEFGLVHIIDLVGCVKVVEGILVWLDCCVDVVEARLDKAFVVVEHTVFLVVLNCKFVMLKGFIELSELVVLDTSKVVVISQLFFIDNLFIFLVFFNSDGHREVK